MKESELKCEENNAWEELEVEGKISKMLHLEGINWRGSIMHINYQIRNGMCIITISSM